MALQCGFALFLIQQMGLTLAIAVWLPGLRDPHFSQKASQLRQRIQEMPSRPLTVVMLGSSRTAYGFAAGSLEKPLRREIGQPVVAFNFGLLGAGPVTELLTFRRLVQEGPRPSLLLVEVLPPLLAGQVPLYEVEEKRIPTCSLRASELSLIARYREARHADLESRWRRGCLLPWYYHRLVLLSRTFPILLRPVDRRGGFDGTDDSGWVPTHAGGDRQQTLALTHCDCSRYLQGFRLGGQAPIALRALLETCRKEGIPVVLVVMPEGPIFRSWYPPSAWAQVERFLGTLREEFGVPVVNAREWLPEEAFLDSHHLLPHAAQTFTRRLGSEVITPLLISESVSNTGE